MLSLMVEQQENRGAFMLFYSQSDYEILKASPNEERISVFLYISKKDSEAAFFFNFKIALQLQDKM